MKKLSLLIGGLILTGAVMAQKPVDTAPMSLEGQLGWNASTLSFNSPSLRFRYFVQNNIAGRVTVGVSNTKQTDNFYELPDFSGETGEFITKSNNWTVSIGGEYHFEGTEKLSPYAGLDIIFGGGKETTEATNATASEDDGGVYTPDFSATTERPRSVFGVNLVAGMDYYFVENFYLGLEVGFGFSQTTVKEGTFESTVGGTTTSGSLNSENKNTTLGNNVIGTFRLGWRF